MLLSHFDYLTSVRLEATVLIPAYFGSRHEAVAGCVEFLVELPCFWRTAQQFHLFALRFFQAALFLPKEAGLLFSLLFVTFLYLFRIQQNRLDIERQCSTEGIPYSFIPPRSPQFWGIWEAEVKSPKTHLRRTLANAPMPTEKFQFFAYRICTLEERPHQLWPRAPTILNPGMSRTLTQLSNLPEDLNALMPGNIPVHRPLTAIPKPFLRRTTLQPAVSMADDTGVRPPLVEGMVYRIPIGAAEACGSAIHG